MFRKTPVAREATANNIVGAIMQKHKFDNEHLTARTVWEKEFKKRMRQGCDVAGGLFWGSRINERQIHFMTSNPKTSRILLKRAGGHGQFVHWTQTDNTWELQRQNNEMDHFDRKLAGGAIYSSIWQSSIGFVDEHIMNFIGRRQHYSKDQAIHDAEQWGLKLTVVDSEANTGPRYVDLKKRPHPLYADNFPYIGENTQISNRFYGDADYSWRQGPELDYSSYGAKTVSPYNYFRPSRFDAIRGMQFYNSPYAANAAATPAASSAPKVKVVEKETPKAAAATPVAAATQPAAAVAEEAPKKDTPAEETKPKAE